MRKFAVSCAAITIAIPLLAACGGSSDEPSANGITIPTDGAAKGSSNPVGDIAEQKFKVTFSGDGTSDETTYAQDGKGHSSFSEGDSQYFISPDGNVTCRKSSTGAAECTKVSGVGAPVSPLIGYYNAGKGYLDQLGGKLGDRSTKTIAGRSASCVTFSAKDIGGVVGGALASKIKDSLTYCSDKDTGVPLELSRTDSAGKTTVALAVTKFEEPSSSDFTPPATPKDAPGISLPPGLSIPNQ